MTEDNVLSIYCGFDIAKNNFDTKLTRFGRVEDFETVCPATKKQCETLFKAMADTGYEWNPDKKELKKIEPIPIFRVGDTLKRKGKDYTFVVDRIQGGYYHCDHSNGAFFPIEEQDNWELVEQKPAEWSEEDERMCQETIDWFEKKCFPYALESENPARESIKWLKSLKDRVQPKQEWKQENVEELSDFENAMMHIGGSFFGENAGLDPNDTNAIKEQANLLLELVPSKEWSEDDEYGAERLLGWLDTLVNYIHYDTIVSLDLRRDRMQQVEQLKNWLKSLKDRVVPQPKQQWSEEDEQYLLVCKNALNKYESTDKWDANIIFNWLKSLKDKITWKPKDFRKTMKGE